MKQYIDRDDVIAAFRYAKPLLEQAEALPAADVVERRRGTWVPFASHAALGTFVKCSECGKTGDAAWAGCPWCLAVMDKAPEEAK